MKKLINELKKELLNKEMTLLDMDNAVMCIANTGTSLFDTENECIEALSCGYYMEDDIELVVEFGIIDKQENNLKTIVKITNIWLT